MAGRFCKVTLLAVLANFSIFITLSHSQEPSGHPSNPLPSPATQTSDSDQAKEKRDHPPRNKDKSDADMPRKIFENLPPEQQQKMRENYERWMKMTPEERKAMREREMIRREKILQEIEDAIKASGLELDQPTRDMYVMRYTLARREIEEKLQKEIEEKRRPLLKELINRLKEEFKDKSSPTSTSPSPSPQVSGSSK